MSAHRMLWPGRSTWTKTVAVGGLVLAVTACMVCACASSTTEPSGPAERRSAIPLQFHLETPDGDVLDSEALRGRVTLIVVITTFDMASQLMVRQLKELGHTHVPRINVGAIIMEAPAYAELRPTFKRTFELDYPVVMADFAMLQGRGPFGEVVHIPTTLVIDRQGYETERFRGPVSQEQLVSALSRAR